MTQDLPAAARETLAALHARELGAVELIDATIARIDESTLGAVELLDADGAREQARAADAALASGTAGPLAGVPVLVKDVIDVAGLPTRGGTARWRRLSERDADCVAALRAAGAVLVGKGHTNELAFGIDGRNPHRPPCVNPHDRTRLPGGSSSGPAVALAGGLVLGALGTDTSGSIRVPAALCGVAGLRPSYGLLSRRGALPLAPSYDVVGPLARSVADLRLLFDALLAGAGAGAGGGGGEGSIGRPARPISRVAVIDDLIDPAVCEPNVAAAVRDAAAALERGGVAVANVAIPELAEALAVHRDVQVPEAAGSVHALGVPEDELGPEVRERVRSARGITPERHADARHRRVLIAGAIDRAMPVGGALLAPGCPIVAPARDANEWRFGDETTRTIRDALLSCTVPLTQPSGPVVVLSISISDGLPIGAQLLARSGDDVSLIDLATQLEDELALPSSWMRVDRATA